MAPLRASGVPLVVVLLAAQLLLTACSSAPAGTPSGPGPGNASTTPAGSVSGGDVEAAKAVLGKARLSDEPSLGALEGIRFSAAGREAAAGALAAGATGDALWAATYVYASSTADPAPLLLVAANATASPSVRAMAAAALLSLGKAEGFDPLIAALDVDAAMDGADPPTSAWEFAASVLERYTKAGIAPAQNRDPASHATVANAWRVWLTANRAHLRFDQASSLWLPA